jgi:tetratricopeptide (TPR) repeat protein
MLRALLLLVLTTSVVSAKAEARDRDQKSDQKSEKKSKRDKADKKPEPPPKAPRTPGPDDATAVAILERIVKGPDSASRQKAIDELGKITPTALEAVGEWIVRTHTSTVQERRDALAYIEAQVPDKDGRFKAPDRKTNKELKADDDIDWLKKLLELDPAMPGVGEIIADVAAIRALVATNDTRATQYIFDAAFAEETMIYRDECGRYLRKLEPYSIPTLTKESASRVGDRKRYATYQLERLDRQEPNKAFAAAAGDEALTLEIIGVYRSTKIREAVHAMWGKVNDDRTRVRAAAREAWMDYITGAAPPKAPMKKLQLPGGKLTKKEKPLWLNYRELADNELRQASNELLHTDYQLEDPMSLDDKIAATVEKIDQVAVTNELFAFYDGERKKLDGAQWAQASAKAAGGDLAGATDALDRLLAQNPDRAERADMAKIYFAWARQLEDKKAYADAAVAYSKAQGLDPKGPHATDALAAQHYMQGKALEAAGKDGGPDYRKAVALKPDYAPAEDAAERVSPSKKPTWMLYAAVIAGGFAALLFAAAMMKRRRT